MTTEPGVKLDEGKPQADLLLDFSRALEEVVKVLDYGAKKYTEHGWLKVENAEQRYKAALMRHILAKGREDIDPESGLSHDAHIAWNALAILELRLRREDCKIKACKEHDEMLVKLKSRGILND